MMTRRTFQAKFHRGSFAMVVVLAAVAILCFMLRGTFFHFIGLACLMAGGRLVDGLVNTTYVMTPDGLLLTRRGRASRTRSLSLADIVSATPSRGGMTATDGVTLTMGDGTRMRLYPCDTEAFVRELRRRTGVGSDTMPPRRGGSAGSHVLALCVLAMLSALLHAQTVDGIVAEGMTARDTVAEPWAQRVAREIDAELSDDMFDRSQVAVLVYDLDADSVVYRHNERQLLRPASTIKLVTAITALERLGGRHLFNTELRRVGEIADSTFCGDLYVKGGFDPLFSDNDLDTFVQSLIEWGVDTVRGRIIADVTFKDTIPYGKGWCWDDDNPVLTPLTVEHRDGFVERFVERMRKRGIQVEATTLMGGCPDSAILVVRRSHTMDQVLGRMIKHSDNMCAEAVFYHLAAAKGKPYAKADDAVAEIKAMIRRLGLNPANYRIADGSGLSLYNYVTAELEVAMLRHAWHTPAICRHLYPSLPQAGYDGTLRKRLRGDETQSSVCAKTGSLTGVSTLAGYCTAGNGHNLAFAIFNQGILYGREGRDFQDRLCAIMCRP